MNEVRKLKELFDELQIREHGIEKSLSGGSPLISDFDSNAEDFLEAAEEAFELSKHANAVSDAKRAIYCQIDEVLDCLGYPWKRKAVTKKLDVIKKCGFAAPRILRRVNAARNLLEHDMFNRRQQRRRRHSISPRCLSTRRAGISSLSWVIFMWAAPQKRSMSFTFAESLSSYLNATGKASVFRLIKTYRPNEVRERLVSSARSPSTAKAFCSPF
jgi:hypothetical protein